MLQQDETAIRPQHPPDFGQGQLGLLDAAKDKRPQNCVKGAVGKRQPLGIGAGHGVAACGV